MKNEQLARHLLNDLDATESAELADRLRHDPALAEQLESMRHLVQLMVREGEFEPIETPRNLAEDTIRLIFSREERPEPATEPGRYPTFPAARPKPQPVSDPIYPVWRRADLVVSFVFAFFAVGLGLAGIGKLRKEYEIAACQNQMRGLHTALIGYSELKSGRLPQVGSPEVPTAGAVAEELVRNGLLAGTESGCPAQANPEAFAYTLGYRTGDKLIGPRLPGEKDLLADWTPVAADTRHGNHPNGWNVLYLGGQVRTATTVQAGYNGDDIFQNLDGEVRAGLNRYDASLGSGRDIP